MEDQQGHPTNPPQGGEYSGSIPQNLPNSTTVLVLGILSIVLSCWYFSIIGVVLSIIALVLAGKDLSLYQSNPAGYTQSSVNNLKAGRVCAIIGLTVAIIFFIIVILIIAGILVSMPFWGMID
jgi:hypothetical protein